MGLGLTGGVYKRLNVGFAQALRPDVQKALPRDALERVVVGKLFRVFRRGRRKEFDEVVVGKPLRKDVGVRKARVWFEGAGSGLF